MSWTFQQRPPGRGVDPLLRSIFSLEEYERIVDAALVNLSELYIAYRSAEGRTVALVFLVRFERDGTWGYKDMNEDMGPYYYNCPKRILDELDPTDNENALNWRAACRVTLAKRERAKGVKPGTWIRTHPMTFGDGETRNEFKLIKGSIFAGRDGVRVRLNNWRTFDFEIMETTAA